MRLCLFTMPFELNRVNAWYHVRHVKVFILFTLVWVGLLGCRGASWENPNVPTILHVAPNTPGRIYLSSSFHNAEIGLNSPHTTIDWLRSLFGSIVTDNAGNYSMSGTYSLSGSGVGTYNESGTYLLLPDGTLSYYSPDFNPLNGGISSANDIFIYAGVSDLTEQIIGVGVEKGSGGYTLASLYGDYYFATLTRGNKWNYTEEGKIHFDGAGNYTISGICSESGMGVNLPLNYSGTYLVNPDGTFSYSTPLPATFNGGISSTGGILVFGNVSDPNRQGFGIAVKVGPTNFSNASLNTTFRFVEILDGNADSPYPFADTPVPYTIARVGTVNFNGVNNFTSSGTYSSYTDGIIKSFSDSGQCQLNNDGTFSLITLSDSLTRNGGISASGNVIVYSSVGSTTVKCIGIMIK
jgi:hypothetical protein